MRKRNHQINVRLDENELKKLEKKVAKSGLTREAYIHKVLNGSKVYPTPPVEFYDLIREVRRIGNNINQLTRISNAGEKMDVMLLNNAKPLDRTELYRTRLALRSGYENAAIDGLRKMPGGDFSVWDFRDAVAAADNTLGERAEENRVRELLRTQERQTQEKPSRRELSR